MTASQKNFAEEYYSSWSKYDFIVNLFQLGQDNMHRTKALKLAALKAGDTVLDLCCGSGLSLRAIESIIGAEGKIIAIDANEKMLELAVQRAHKHGWKNISFLHSDIEAIQLKEEADFALFALCWYERELCTNWVKYISKMIKLDGTLCFLDYKLPDNWLRYITTPLIKVLVKWLGEAYGIEELKWNPNEEIGTLLQNPKSFTYYLDGLITINGQPKKWD